MVFKVIRCLPKIAQRPSCYGVQPRSDRRPSANQTVSQRRSCEDAGWNRGDRRGSASSGRRNTLSPDCTHSRRRSSIHRYRRRLIDASRARQRAISRRSSRSAFGARRTAHSRRSRSWAACRSQHAVDDASTATDRHPINRTRVPILIHRGNQRRRPCRHSRRKDATLRPWRCPFRGLERSHPRVGDRARVGSGQFLCAAQGQGAR